MPTSKNPPEKRDYKHEYAEYQGRPEQIKHRAERNAARAAATKSAGHALSGDVAHIKALDNGGKNVASNERVEAVAQNRSWRRGQKGYHVPVDK